MASFGSQHGPLVWIDCEMTGLDHMKDRIIEIAVLITDGNLELVDEVGCHYVVKTSKEVLDSMGEWCTTQHGRSGLTNEAINSPHTPQQVASYVLAYIKRWAPEPHTGILAGSSVHADARFLGAKGPDAEESSDTGVWHEIIQHLHYRIVGTLLHAYDNVCAHTPSFQDVSSIKELCRRWYPEEAQCFKESAAKESSHR
ncbi:RNA exonuclease Rex2 [Ceratobasidium sp. AG-Ba]|nr:RNA exonuclease Rex2 [Ceratobasidium sp. AG-Ba]